MIYKRARGSILLSKLISVKEKVVERKIIFFKSTFEIKAIRKTAEKAKSQMFSKYFFLKSKPEESEINTIDKYFEPYIVVDGVYSIDFSKEWRHSIKVNEEMQILKISNKNFEPNFMDNRIDLPYKVLELEGTGRFYHEERKRIVFDEKWNEVRLDLLPYLPFEEDVQEILSESVNQQLTEGLNAEKEVEILKSKIFKRPTDFSIIHKEWFNVSERALVFKPMYRVTATHTKTQKKVTFVIDGVNGKISSENTKKTSGLTTEGFKEIGSNIFSTVKNKTEKVYSLIMKTGKGLFTKKRNDSSKDPNNK